MYYGIVTPTLKSLYKKYEEKWGCTPDFYENAEYGTGINEYRDYVRDIKKSLELGIELPELYPHDDEF